MKDRAPNPTRFRKLARKETATPYHVYINGKLNEFANRSSARKFFRTVRKRPTST